MAIRRLLIANRGEIARRIIRTCRRLKIETVAVCAPSEFYSPYIQEADFRYEFPSEDLADTFLSPDRILKIAEQFQADAIHPGYGFLSENADFAEQVAASGIIFVGPSPDVIRQLGEKHRGIELAKSLSIPTVPGNKDGDNKKLSVSEIEAIGFPLMIKAAFGGGGRGMRLVTEKSQLEDAIKSSRRESQAAFGRDDIICERYIFPSRHIEIQLIGDKKGNLLHLYERDCSLQRRYQKVIEEAPAPGLDSGLRQQILDAALKLGKTARLDNAATVEFILAVDSSGKSTGEFFFMEVNPRLQVEHTVTEEITGVDIVELQLIAASGDPLSLQQSAIQSKGHAIQARICSEQPSKNFAPSFGSVVGLHFPNSSALRIESSLAIGAELSGRYDSLLLKVIGRGKDRQDAAKELSNRLYETEILGITSNLSFLADTLQHRSFSENSSYPCSTTFGEVQREYAAPISADDAAANSYAALELEQLKLTTLRLPNELLGFRSDRKPRSTSDLSVDINFDLSMRRFIVKVDDIDNEVSFLARTERIYGSKTSGTIELELALNGNNPAKKSLNWALNDGRIIIAGQKTYRVSLAIGDPHTLSINNVFGELKELPVSIRAADKDNRSRSNHIVPAPLPGRILEIKVTEGTEVKKGTVLLVLESMKTEHFIYADEDGVVKTIHVAIGGLVKAKEPLITFK